MADYTGIAKALMGTDNPDLTTYDFAPQRMPERGMRRIARKLISDVDLTPDEYSRLGEHERYKEQVGEPAARDAIQEFAGVNSIRRGAKDIVAAYDKSDVLQGLSGGAQIATGLLPGAALTKVGGRALGALYATPLRAGSAGGALAVPTVLADRAEAQ